MYISSQRFFCNPFPNPIPTCSFARLLTGFVPVPVEVTDMYPCDINLNINPTGQRAGYFNPASASAPASATLQTAGLPALTQTTNSFIGVHPSKSYYHIFTSEFIQRLTLFFSRFPSR